MLMASEFLKKREHKRLTRANLLSMRFDLLNEYDPLIDDEILNIPEADLIEVSSKMDPETRNIMDEYHKNKTRAENKIKEKIKNNSEKLADMILDIDCSEYESIDSDDNQMVKRNVYKNNLKRIIRVRNIMKKRLDNENDFLGIEDIMKFKKLNREGEDDVIRALKKFGPPTFLKTKFKKETMEKYKIVNGKYFGVMC